MGWGKRQICLPGATLVVCALVVGGCAECRVPRIDPTGERVFAPAPEPARPAYTNVPGAPRPWDTVEMILVPRTTVAPVGSEVVLLAAVSGHDGYLRASERVEWSIAPGGVGEFVDFDRASFCDVFVGDFHRPEKVNSTFVTGYTSRRYVRLTRGTPAPGDDVTVLRGQTWASVRSPVEGTSYVTAYAPDVHGWEQRKQTAIVYWIDAQWRFPPPAITATGSRHVFTTMIMRQTDQSPLAGWRVQYSVVDGPPAGFAPSGSPTVEVETNATGQASAEIFQAQQASGTNRIAIQVIRPARPNDPTSARLVVGSGFTSKTWSAPGLTVRKSGPATASVGATLPYRIEVTNTGDMPSDGVVLTDEVPDALSFMSSNPLGQLTGRNVQWQVGRLGPGERRVFDVNLRAERQGSVSSCAEAVAGGLRAKDCVTTAISLAVPPGVSTPGSNCVGPTGAAPPLDVRVTGPERAYVGDLLTFEIIITNRGTTTATGIVIKDSYDRGLVHETAAAPIKRALNVDLPAGQSKRIGVELHAAAPGQQCQTVEITANGGSVASTRFCTTVIERGVPGATPTAPGTNGSGPTSPSPTGARGLLSVKVTGPQSATVGEQVDFFIELSNDGNQPLTSVKVVADFDQVLEPKGASEAVAGYEGDAPYWTAASLAAGQKKLFQVRCACTKESPNACLRTKATATEADPATQNTCVPIRAAAAPGSSGLSMMITSLRPAINLGKELTYLVRVTNNGKADDAQVVVKVTLPPELIPSRLATRGPTSANFQGQVVEFQPAARIAPGQTLEYSVVAQARTAGDVLVRGEVTSRNQPKPNGAEARTTINPAQ